VKLIRCESRGSETSSQFPDAFFETMVPSNAGWPVPSVRILLRGTVARKPCRPRAVALQWNYY